MISLPPGVTFEKHLLTGGGWSFDFRHRTLGALGRILLQDMGWKAQACENVR
jgi:hypothetical protein